MKICYKLIIGLLVGLLAVTPAHAVVRDKVKVSNNDTTPGFLNGKLVGGSGIELTEGSDGSNETLTVSVSEGGSESTAVGDTAEIDLTLTGTTITGALVAASIDEAKLDASVNSSLDLADSAVQPAGNVATATALAANGSNCSSGSAPLGVGANGASESCFDVWTEAENTSAAYAPLASPTFTGTVVIPTPFTLGAVSVLPTGTELNYVDGVTSAIQTQLNAKQATVTAGSLANDVILEEDLKAVDAASDEECLTYETTTGDFEWQACGGAGSVEGTAVLSTGETGGSKFLREDGDGTSSWQTISGGGDALTSSPLSQFAATTSAQLRGVLSDETGTGIAYFVGGALGTPSSATLTNASGTAASLTAGLATALAANGSNCSAGSAPLGVDASGAAETCTDYEEDLSNEAGLYAALSDVTQFYEVGDDVTADVSAASSSASGIAELAIASEVDTGTDTARAITPDALAGSNLGEKAVSVYVVAAGTATAVGDGKAYFNIPSSAAGMDLVEVHAHVITAGTTGTTDIQIHNLTSAVDMLSTKLTVDSAETSSSTAATAAVINGANDDVIANELIRIDIDAISTTPAQGLVVTLVFRLP